MKRLMAACGIALMLMLGTGAMAAAPVAGGTANTTHVIEPARTTTEGHAAEGAGGQEGHEPDPIKEELHLGTWLVTIAIFVVLVLVLSKTAWKPILTGLKNREQAIRDSIEAAQRAKADADRTTKELEQKMAEFQRQAAAQLNQAKIDAQRVADSIRQQAETESAALKDRTLREIGAAKEQAVSEINTHAAELGTAVARKILQRNVTVDDQQRLVEESLSEMAKKN